MEKEALAQFLTQDKIREQNETLTILDALRRSRKSRGGTGAPLESPKHLSEATQTIILTDALNVESR